MKNNALPDVSVLESATEGPISKEKQESRWIAPAIALQEPNGKRTMENTENLKDLNESLKKQNTALFRQVLDLLAIKAEYETALLYYADGCNWSARNRILLDDGERARGALQCNFQ